MKDALGGVQSILILGGASDIGAAIAKALAVPRGVRVILAGRGSPALDRAAEDVKAATGVQVDTVDFDADEINAHERFVTGVFDAYGDIDVVVVAFGILGDAVTAQSNASTAAAIAHTNFVGAVSVITAITYRLREQGHGDIVVLSSVAGERVRKANYVYGASKAGLDGFAQGLGDSLVGSGVHVLVVRPGFVRTKMTENLPSPPLATTPEAVARAVVRGLNVQAHTVWVPGNLRWLMMLIRHLPRPLFRRLPF